jgi:hypothetical protein
LADLLSCLVGARFGNGGHGSTADYGGYGFGASANAGSASGINNAVARAAGVLAIAVLGSVMVKAFASHLDLSLAKMKLPPNIMEELRSREGELRRREPPQGLDQKPVLGIQDAISESFVFAFRVVLLCCAGLSVGSSVLAVWLIAPSTITGITSGDGERRRE